MMGTKSKKKRSESNARRRRDKRRDRYKRAIMNAVDESSFQHAFIASTTNSLIMKALDKLSVKVVQQLLTDVRCNHLDNFAFLFKTDQKHFIHLLETMILEKTLLK